MAKHEEGCGLERGSDALPPHGDFAAQLAAIVFELHLAGTRAAVPASRERSASGELWMSRIIRRTGVTS